ncbi:four helix bundle protein [Chryseobacterium joostei]|uniref:Four helix bundle protein n=1 Tax=Chryseobacterium joostei TaxID=112234 RepID=A0A1N7IAV7_9FLAO|nr:four helix bundle protein [Chryseobacterium joostei]AZB01234.1 four helix bundle protein [Chryseobacterium joostei]SIS34183.1 four helix bundle protein [Chryseobacterium joostei]
MANFKELLVWQKSIDFVTDIYRATELFPKSEIYGLISQIRRAAVSIPSNIAEGNSRRSCAEIETQLTICKNLNLLNEESYLKLNQGIIEITKMLNGLINSLQ